MVVTAGIFRCKFELSLILNLSPDVEQKLSCRSLRVIRACPSYCTTPQRGTTGRNGVTDEKHAYASWVRSTAFLLHTLKNLAVFHLQQTETSTDSNVTTVFLQQPQHTSHRGYLKSYRLDQQSS